MRIGWSYFYQVVGLWAGRNFIKIDLKKTIEKTIDKYIEQVSKKEAKIDPEWWNKWWNIELERWCDASTQDIGACILFLTSRRGKNMKNTRKTHVFLKIMFFDSSSDRLQTCIKNAPKINLKVMKNQSQMHSKSVSKFISKNYRTSDQKGSQNWSKMRPKPHQDDINRTHISSTCSRPSQNHQNGTKEWPNIIQKWSKR